jgi:histidine ammonia-lyase
MSICLSETSLTIEKLVDIARTTKVELAPAASNASGVPRHDRRKIAAKEIMYGINTGVGEFSRRC